MCRRTRTKSSWASRAPPPNSGADRGQPAGMPISGLTGGRRALIWAAMQDFSRPSRRRLAHMAAARGGARAGTGDNSVRELLRQAEDFTVWDHYPRGDVYDRATHSQYYCHAHPPAEKPLRRVRAFPTPSCARKACRWRAPGASRELRHAGAPRRRALPSGGDLHGRGRPGAPPAHHQSLGDRRVVGCGPGRGAHDRPVPDRTRPALPARRSLGDGHAGALPPADRGAAEEARHLRRALSPPPSGRGRP